MLNLINVMARMRQNKITQKAAEKRKSESEKFTKKQEQKTSSPKYCFPIQFIPVKRKTRWHRLKKGGLSIFQKSWGVILLFSGLFVFKDQIHQIITPSQKLWEEKTYIDGLSVPLYNLDLSKSINVVFGGSANNPAVGMGIGFNASSLGEYVIYRPTIIGFAGSNETPFDLKFLRKKDSLYVSISLCDIEGMYIGRINFDQIELRNSMISHYHIGADNIEIIDNHNFVLFNMIFKYPNTVIINGYYISPGGVEIASDGGFTFAPNGELNKDTSKTAIDIIRKIPQLNSY